MSDAEFISLEKKVEDIAGKLDEVHYALMGSALAKDGGMIRRLMECEEGLEDIHRMIIQRDESIAAKEKKQIKVNVQTNLIWAGVASFLTWLVSVLIDSIKFHGK